MPSRRWMLASSSLAIAGSTGSRRIFDRPLTLTESAEIEWPMARYDAAGTGANSAAVGPKDGVQLRWESNPDASVRGPAAPILCGDTLFCTGRASLVAVDCETGHVRFERDGYSYLSGPTRAEASAYQTDALAVRGREGIHGLSAGGGYTLAGYTVGLERWHAPGREPLVRTSANPTPPSPVAADGVVYAVIPETNRVVALDANSGRVRWEYAIGDEQASQPNRPVIRDETVYVTSWPDYVAALDARTGDPLWTDRLKPQQPADDQDYREVRPPTATAAGLIVPSRRAVSCLNPGTGELRWEYVHGGSVTDGSVAVAEGVVFVTDGTESLHAIDLETGEGIWTTEYQHDVRPIVADGIVYLGYFWLTELVAIDAETGDRRWSHEVGHGLSQPIVGDELLYVVANDRIVALEEGA